MANVLRATIISARQRFLRVKVGANQARNEKTIAKQNKTKTERASVLHAVRDLNRRQKQNKTKKKKRINLWRRISNYYARISNAYYGAMASPFNNVGFVFFLAHLSIFCFFFFLSFFLIGWTVMMTTLLLHPNSAAKIYTWAKTSPWGRPFWKYRTGRIVHFLSS